MQLTRPHAVKTVKYVNPHGGTWTVAAQRIPAQSKDVLEAEAVSPVYLIAAEVLQSFILANTACCQHCIIWHAILSLYTY